MQCSWYLQEALIKEKPKQSNKSNASVVMFIILFIWKHKEEQNAQAFQSITKGVCRNNIAYVVGFEIK